MVMGEGKNSGAKIANGETKDGTDLRHGETTMSCVDGVEDIKDAHLDG
tara:strand:- start:206 stop:349 length:144 start_codon:yes stop_codon:yes gene_type:complete